MIFKVDGGSVRQSKKCACKPFGKLMEIGRQKHVNWASNSYRLAAKSNEFECLSQIYFSLYAQQVDVQRFDKFDLLAQMAGNCHIAETMRNSDKSIIQPATTF